MWGPVTLPMTFACTPKWPSASTTPAATWAWLLVSGADCAALERVSSLAASGRSHSKLGSSVTTSRNRPRGVSAAPEA